MNFRTTLVLIACLLVFGTLYLLTRGGLTQGPPTPTQADLLVPGGLLHIKVTRGEKSYELRRGAAGWEQITPVWFPLTSEAGQAWATAVRNLIPQRELMPGLEGTPSLVELSLSPSAATVELVTDRGAFALGLGDQTVSQAGYVRADDGRVFAVPDTLHTLVFQSGMTDRYVRELPTPPLSSLHSILIDRPREPVTLNRRDNVWSLTPDQTRRVAPVQLEAIARLLQNTGVQSFAEAPVGARDASIANNDRRYGLDKPRVRVVLRQSGGTTYILEVGRSSAIAAQTVFARLSRDQRVGPVMTIPAAATEPLLVSWPQFRDRRVFVASPSQVRRLRIARPERGDVVIEDTGAGFAFIGAGAPATMENEGEAARLVESLLAWETDQFIGDYQTRKPPVATLHLAWGITQKTRVDLYRDGDGYVAKRADEPDGLVLPSDAVTPLLGFE